MKHSCLKFRWLLLDFLYGVLLLSRSSGLEPAPAPAPAPAPTSGDESDRLALLDLKNQITQDPLQIMSSWNDSNHFCNWVGVTCSSSNGRVINLNLDSQDLVGSIPPSIGNLTFLTGINFQINSFHGEIPQEIGRLLRLQHLNFSYNSFGGKIPTNLSQCTELRVLDVEYNELVGQIPDQLSSLLKLFYLGLGVNYLTGNIPAWIGNFSSLSVLSLFQNSLEGVIPHDLGRLSSLGFFRIFSNKLSGTIPPSIYNISSIYFSVVQNQLQGRLPPDVGLTLPNLQFFAGGMNNFTGPIPSSLSNASGLGLIDFSQNRLTGTVPVNLGSLQSLHRLNFENNSLGNGELGDLNFLTSLANCSSLRNLGLSLNRFGGELPSSIANLSIQLTMVTLGSNLLYGSIPIGIGNLINLTRLGMERNFFNGSVPDVLGKLQNLNILNLHTNKFSGPIPSSFGNLTKLNTLYIDNNRLEGNIPPSLGNCQNLLRLNLSRNNLNGTIPKEVVSLSSLSISLVLAHNSLTGSLPFEVGKLINLVELDVSDNKLSGEIPSTLGSCVRLEYLSLGGNSIQGTIPQSLISLRGLISIDLSHNNLSGKIPDFLGGFSSLKSLNLSFNDFKGEVPREGIFANASVISILGNNKLCGGATELLLPACSSGNPHSSGKLRNNRVLIPVITVVVFVIILSCSFATCYIIKYRKKGATAISSSKDWQSGVSYLELVKSTNGFSADNLIGSGSFGSVYKGILSSGEIVAVKVLNLEQEGASRSFIDECKALRSVRHRNLLKIITACSSIDHLSNDFKALVFDFMSNGSLDQWLHPGDGGQHRVKSLNFLRRLNISIHVASAMDYLHHRCETPRDDEKHRVKSLSFVQRLNIGIDVASALDYLHHHCETPIIHCDLKPSNVLLDGDMTAHVSDFGLARFLFKDSNDPSKNQTISVGLRGSIGYIPPEYGTGGQVSALGDVYSYGILLLEMFSGKRPTDDMFKDGLSIQKFIAVSLPERVTNITDPSMLFEEEENDEEKEGGSNIQEQAIINYEDLQSSARSRIEECLISVMNIGLSCSNTLPRERMAMNDVVNKMHAIRDSFLGFKNKNRRKIRKLS